MKDIKVHDLRSLVDVNQAGKTGKKPRQGDSGEFSRTLESAVSRLNEVSSQGTPKAEGIDSTSTKVDSSLLKEEVTASNEQFQQMMKAGEDLQKLYLTLTRKSDDRS